MERLLAGYRRFRANVWPVERARYETLAAAGQRPETLVIACSDSRVDPQTVFGAIPGELFVIRNIAGLVPRYQPDSGYHGTSAALEYGVRVLNVSRIVVLGHAQCGGVRAMVEGSPDEACDFVQAWMKIAEPALGAPARPTSCGNLAHYELEVVRLSVANLLTFPWIAQLAAAGQLAIHGFRFDIRSGALSLLEKDRFVEVT